MIATITVTQGKDVGKVFRLAEGETKVLGRSNQADIILLDEGVSRQHCRVRLADGRLLVADLSSKNGTSLNGRALDAEAPVAEGDVIKVGLSLLKVTLRQEATKPGTQPGVQALELRDPMMDVLLDPIEAHVADLTEPGAAMEPEDDSESVMGAFERYLEGRAAPEEATADAPPAVTIQPVAEPPRREKVRPDALIGKVFSGFRIDGFVGEDEISRIYAATQLSMERKVSLKILSPQMTGESRAVERFIAAARAAGKLSHPNIVQVYDAGQEGDVYFIAIERVEGKSLREHLRARGRNRPLKMDQSLDTAEQIADALTYAHAQAVVHGNINLDNIFLTPHNVAKLAEMGFSHRLSDSGMKRPSRFGERPGDLQFVAPEQLIDPRAASDRSDVYALGAVLFVLLTGHMPFRGETAQEVTERVREGRHEIVRRLQRDVPEELQGLVDRAMSTRAENRFQGAIDFLRVLRELRTHLLL